MFTKNAISISMVASVVYLVLLAIFAFNSNYLNIVLLYIGNGLFFSIVLFGLIRQNKLAGGNASSSHLFRVGWSSTLLGVIITTAVGLILFYMQKSMVPAGEVLQNMPEAGSEVEQDDMFLTILTNTLIVNAILGVVASIIGSGVIKKNQKSPGGRESVQ